MSRQRMSPNAEAICVLFIGFMVALLCFLDLVREIRTRNARQESVQQERVDRATARN